MDFSVYVLTVFELFYRSLSGVIGVIVRTSLEMTSLGRDDKEISKSSGRAAQDGTQVMPAQNVLKSDRQFEA
jgi:hypothetical protein